MKRERLILGISLILNVVLFILLFLSNRAGLDQPTGQEIAEASPVAPVSSPEALPTETATLVPMIEAESEIQPSATPSPEPTATVTAVPTTQPEPTATPMPPPTIPPTPAPSPTNVPGPDWLRYTNLFRIQANLPQLRENVTWSEGSRLHSVYMLNTNKTAHDEDINSPWFTNEGNDAGVNGNIAASGWLEAPNEWPIDYWISAPFHLLPLVDPRLAEVGFGIHRDGASALKMTGTMDVQRGVGELPEVVEYPIFYPKDGGETWVIRYSLPEFPNPLTSCQGLAKPVGSPIVLQLGSGDVIPSVSSTSLLQGNEPIQHCVIDETRYVNSSAYWQETGRTILDERDAIVIIPAAPLVIGQTYTVQVDVNGESYNWSFDAVASPEFP